ncbi:MAG: rRNA maturation RNase YbeY [Alphaproteobacteria bacterium]|nr:rRNA maturation RNase YbeY [Alphaproteobacteria bacterium]
MAERVIALALARARADIRGPLEVSVLLTGDAEQQVINNDWRGIDKPTNVLSFPQGEPFAPLSGPIGDLSLAFETLVREAGELGKPFAEHFAHLLVHGTLHLVGYDHQTEDQALVMEGLETEILAELGIADPYADGA